MKRYALIVALVLTATFLHAESVWTGNAAVAGDSEFPGESDIFRAASNSFPTGTILKVTNPRGGRSVDVSVVGRLESPGVFILMEKDAAATIGLPEDHVVPVRVSPSSTTAAKSTAETEVADKPLSEDSDYNPVAGLDESYMEPRTALVEIPESKVADLPDTSVEVPEDDEFVEYSVPSDGEESVPMAVVSNESVAPAVSDPIYTYEIDSSDTSKESSPEFPETAVEEFPEKDSKKSVFFLMPSDPRPPESAGKESEDTKIISAEPVESAGITSSPMAIPRLTAGDSMLPLVPVGDNRPYIQIGAYTDRLILEESAGKISYLAPGYPLSMAEESGSGKLIYKLLIGPLKPAETGIVLQTARTSIFPDAFPYSP